VSPTPPAPASDVLDQPSLMDALGGRKGLLDSAAPALTFVVVFVATGQQLTPALVAALVAGGLVAVVRLARRDTLRHVAAGFGGVALSVVVARTTGRPADFFLPSLVANLAAAAAWALSIWVRRPLLGVVVGTVTRSRRWRSEPVLLRAYQRASWIWTASFLVRAAVMTPLWLAGEVVALGIAKVALGWPMVLVVIWLSWQVLQPAYRAVAAADERTRGGTPAPNEAGAAASVVDPGRA
jgi:hypothetical protein